MNNLNPEDGASILQGYAKNMFITSPPPIQEKFGFKYGFVETYFTVQHYIRTDFKMKITEIVNNDRSFPEKENPCP